MAVATSGGATRRRGSLERQNRAGWLFSLPGVVLLGVLLFLPFVLAVYFSFQYYKIGSPIAPHWIGLRNYRELLSDGDFRKSLFNTLLFAGIVMPVQTGLALLLAIMVNQTLPGMAVFRTIFFAPVVTVMVAAATIWKLLLDPDRGGVNALIDVFTGGTHPGWMIDSNWALLGIILASLWQGVGFQMVILLAGLQGIAASLYEAASMDGASKWQQFRNITLPGVRNTLIFVSTVTAILSFRLYDQARVMAPNGDGSPDGATLTIMTQAGKYATDRSLIGKGSAIAVILFFIVIGITVIQRIVLRESRDAPA